MFRSIFSLRPFNLSTFTAMKNSKKPKLDKVSKTVDDPTEEANSAISVGKNGEIVLRIKAQPGSKRSIILGIDENEVKVSLAAKPVDGQANKELLEFMASSLTLRKTEVELRTGAKSRSKMLVINSDRFNVNDIKRMIDDQINS